MSDTATMAQLAPTKAAPTWVELATQEISELQAAAKEDPKKFWGNHVLGTGEGLLRVRALLPVAKLLKAALEDLNRA